MTIPDQIPQHVDRRFRDAAATSGLLDVAYDGIDSPVGRLVVAASGAGICLISWREQDAVIEELARSFGPRVLRSPQPLTSALRQLDEYFAGRRREFELAVDLSPLPAFQRLVLTELTQVAYGDLATYGTLAQRVGKPSAARAVGGALNRNPVPIVVPCHRVIGSNGSLVGYAGGLDRKRLLLELEGALLPAQA
jgi:methylated-DNA-[protein]-cysteine S-methyltransferase